MTLHVGRFARTELRRKHQYGPRYTRGVLAKFAFNAASASKGAVLDRFE